MVERVEFVSFTGKIKKCKEYTVSWKTSRGGTTWGVGAVGLNGGNNIKYVKCEDVDWINQARDRIQWWE
jgi:hypothetical protein